MWGSPRAIAAERTAAAVAVKRATQEAARMASWLRDRIDKPAHKDGHPCSVMFAKRLLLPGFIIHSKYSQRVCG